MKNVFDQMPGLGGSPRLLLREGAHALVERLGLKLTPLDDTLRTFIGPEAKQP